VAVVLTDAAEREVNSAALWYEREATGLGRQFLDAVGAMVERIADNPQQFPLVHREQRRALLKRFPYALYFRVETRSVVVVGCFHGHRNPRVWQSRR